MQSMKKDNDEKTGMPKIVKEPNLFWSQTEGIQTRIFLLTKIRNSLKKDISSSNCFFFVLGAWSEVIDLFYYQGIRRRRARQWSGNFEKYQHYTEICKKSGENSFTQHIWLFPSKFQRSLWTHLLRWCWGTETSNWRKGKIAWLHSRNKTNFMFWRKNRGQPQLTGLPNHKSIGIYRHGR